MSDEGRVSMVREQALAVVEMITPAGAAEERISAGVRIVIRADSGLHKLHFGAPSALAAAGAISRILAALFPDNVTQETPDPDRAPSGAHSSS